MKHIAGIIGCIIIAVIGAIVVAIAGGGSSGAGYGAVAFFALFVLGIVIGATAGVVPLAVERVEVTAPGW